MGFIIVGGVLNVEEIDDEVVNEEVVDEEFVTSFEEENVTDATVTVVVMVLVVTIGLEVKLWGFHGFLIVVEVDDVTVLVVVGVEVKLCGFHGFLFVEFVSLFEEDEDVGDVTVLVIVMLVVVGVEVNIWGFHGFLFTGTGGSCSCSSKLPDSSDSSIYIFVLFWEGRNMHC